MSFRLVIEKELVQVLAVSHAMVEYWRKGKADASDVQGYSDVQRLTRQERERQDVKWGPQTHSLERWLLILVEEVGSVTKLVNKLYDEGM